MPDNKINWDTDDWVKKLKQQAEDSVKYRHKLYKMVNLKDQKKILDVGCGTGAVTDDIAQLTVGKVTAIDIDTKKLEHAKVILTGRSNVKVMEANVLDLPFEDGTFDLVIFNIVLIHVKAAEQQNAINEMTRVTKPGGTVLATLEPDYDGYINYPEDPVSDLMNDSLRKIGADLQTGRKLRSLFSTAGLRTEIGMETETNFLFISDSKTQLEMFEKNVWVVEKILESAKWSKDKIQEYITNQRAKIKDGLVFRFTPGFYAIGRKPAD
jgi:ubiquinone/menaquinone biosynthesis C-methylase UbiE